MIRRPGTEASPVGISCTSYGDVQVVVTLHELAQDHSQMVRKLDAAMYTADFGKRPAKPTFVEAVCPHRAFAVMLELTCNAI